MYSVLKIRADFGIHQTSKNAQSRAVPQAKTPSPVNRTTYEMHRKRLTVMN